MQRPTRIISLQRPTRAENNERALVEARALLSTQQAEQKDIHITQTGIKLDNMTVVKENVLLRSQNKQILHKCILIDRRFKPINSAK